MQRFYGSSSSHGSHKKQDPLALFDKKVSEADAYLQLMIDQVAVSGKSLIWGKSFKKNFFPQKIEKKIENISDPEEKEKLGNIATIGNVSEMSLILQNLKFE